MSDHDRHFHAGEFFRDVARLFRIAGVVADLQLELTAENAAGRVDVGDCKLGAVPELRPKAAYCPVIGPARPMVMSWADAAPPSSMPAPSTMPVSLKFFISFSR
jgi:hypothetical protein